MNIFESQGRSRKVSPEEPRSRRWNDINTLSRRRRSGRPPGASASNGAHGRLPPPVSGGLRSLQPPVETTSALFHGADGADALQRLGRQWRPCPAPATGFWRAAVPRSRRWKRHQHSFTAPTERTPSSASASNGAHGRLPPRFLEGCGPSPPPAETTSAPFRGADGADALQRLGQQWRPWPAPATGFWRAAVPRSRRWNDINTISRRRRSGRPPAPGARPAMVIDIWH